MADNKVNFLRGTSAEYKSSTKDNDTFYYTTDDEKLYLGNKEITGGGGVTIDDALSDTSKNPVQNKVINATLNSKADQTAVDSALAQKANSADVTASLAGKSDIGHTHDSRYYTESEINTKLSEKMNNSIKGVAGGVAELDSSGKVPASQLPSYVDDVLEYSGKSNFPTSGETGKIYVDTATNKTYRWSGSSYTEISASLALGTTSSTAYRGDRGLIAYNHSQSAHAPSNAEANVQSDWNVTDTSSDAYILNKPTKLSEFTNDSGFITSGEIEGGVTYTLSKSGSTITLTGSDGSTSSVTDSDTNTKNTTGSTNTSNKIFLVGATSQTTSSTTYSHDTAYVGTDGCLYSNSKKTVTTDDSRLSDARTPTAHNQASDTINAMTGYSKPTSTSAIATSDTLNTAIGKLEKALDGKADSSHTHSEYLSTSGTAASATKLATARTIQTNLGSTSSASFNGTANITPGVTGTLPIANGGTGATTASAALTALGAAASSHTHSEYANQNAFSNFKVGSTTVAADSATDTLTLAGSNVTITPDTANDKITIGITKENVTDALETTSGTTKYLREDGSWNVPYTHPTTSGNKHIPSGGSSGQILEYDSSGTAKWATHTGIDVGRIATKGSTATVDDVSYTVGTNAERFNGPYNTAIGGYSHAQGYNTYSVGAYSHSEGHLNKSIGRSSHSEGDETIASGNSSHTEGYTTTASSFASHAGGKFNKSMTDSSSYSDNTGDVFVIGNGTAADVLSNAFRVAYNGSVYGLSAFNSSGADYAEFIKPWFDSNSDNEDRVGYFVTIKDGLLYKANDGDYIVGITSGNPSIVGNADEDYYWRYERDEFNRFVYEDAEEEVEQLDENGMPVMVKTGNIIKNAHYKLAADYDSTKQNDYIERKNRPEWSYVGMIGVIPVRDDGTCVAGGFAKCGADGVATKAEGRGFDTFYVIERISDGVVSVELR